MSDLASIVIPAHDRGVILRQAVSSAQAQSHWPVKFIVVDDGSIGQQTCAEIGRLISEDPAVVNESALSSQVRQGKGQFGGSGSNWS